MTPPQYQRCTLAWQDLIFAGAFAQHLLNAQLVDDAKIDAKTIERAAYTTALIVTYARAFGDARGHVHLPAKVLLALTPEQREIHDLLIQTRSQIFAHTDAERFSVETEGPRLGEIRTPRVMGFGLHREVVEEMISMIQRLQRELRERMQAYEESHR